MQAEDVAQNICAGHSFAEGTETNRPRSASIGVRSGICSSKTQ